MGDLLQEFGRVGLSPVLPSGHRIGAGRPRDFEANMQCVASVAHRRGVILTRGAEPVGFVDARLFCTTLRAAWRSVREHTEVMVNGLAVSIGPSGSLLVPRSTWNVLRGYASRGETTPDTEKRGSDR